uniref:Large ribosomal subunit protein uL13c n=1 Tax=Polysiphonia sp. TaxID=1967842 RepID=A0A1Z1MUH4_9FLOR|nr:ribosomal protein L13 [Polysiphonia sp.]
MNINKTLITTEEKNTTWYLVDAKNHRLGRLSSKIAYILRNKHRNNYLPHRSGNLKIIIINAQKIQITGNKRNKKKYVKHSGRPGGLKIESFSKLHKKIPERIIEYSIKGMLPKNSLGKKLFQSVKIYVRDIHPHKNEKLITI